MTGRLVCTQHELHKSAIVDIIEKVFHPKYCGHIQSVGKIATTCSLETKGGVQILILDSFSVLIVFI